MLQSLTHSPVIFGGHNDEDPQTLVFQANALAIELSGSPLVRSISLLINAVFFYQLIDSVSNSASGTLFHLYMFNFNLVLNITYTFKEFNICIYIANMISEKTVKRYANLICGHLNKQYLYILSESMLAKHNNQIISDSSILFFQQLQ